MKKCVAGLLLAAGAFSAQNAVAETKFMMDMGLKLPFAAADIVSRNSGTSTELGKVVKWGDASEDFRFKLERDNRAGLELNFKPKFSQEGGVIHSMDLDTYFGWFKPTESTKIVAGTADERHWFRGGEERLVDKFGEIAVVDCHADNELGVYYGLVTDPVKILSFTKSDLGHEAGSVRWDRSYGWSSSQLGNGVEGQGTNVQFQYSQCDTGLFATAVLVGNYKPGSDKTKTIEWTNSSWGKDDADNSVSWVPEPQFRVGYGFRSGSVELVYKSPHFGNNVVAAFYQPRLLRDRLLGTVGVTFANDFADGSAKFGGRANEFTALAFDARVQYKISEKLRAKLFLNYSQVLPGDKNETNDRSKQFGESVYHYKNYKGETVGNKVENGFYAVSSIGYTLPVGMVNLDGGLYWRDLDNNDGFELGENFLSVKGSWTWWIMNGVGLSVGGAWYHRINTGDYGKKINGTAYDGIKDEITLGSYFIIKLGL